MTPHQDLVSGVDISGKLRRCAALARLCIRPRVKVAGRSYLEMAVFHRTLDGALRRRSARFDDFLMKEVDNGEIIARGLRRR